jgi:predicted metal-dependent hydrolase
MMMVNDFKKEVLEWAQELRVNPKEIHVRPMKRKWASCSSKGRVTFSYELLNKSFEQRAKAIVHELLHLKYNSHNKMFASLLSAHLAKKGIKVNSVVL